MPVRLIRDRERLASAARINISQGDIPTKIENIA
jgi:hypothetical protein